MSEGYLDCLYVERRHILRWRCDPDGSVEASAGVAAGFRHESRTGDTATVVAASLDPAAPVARDEGLSSFYERVVSELAEHCRAALSGVPVADLGELDNLNSPVLENIGIQLVGHTTYRPSDDVSPPEVDVAVRTIVQLGPESVDRVIGLRSATAAAIEQAIAAASRTSDPDRASPDEPLPPGEYNLLFPAGAGGVLAHELFGHGAEVDEEAGPTWLARRLGRRVGSPTITVDIDPGRPRGWGSYRIDGLGTPARRVRAVAEGRVAGLLSEDRTPVGSGAGHMRRASFQHPTASRMSNVILSNPGGPDSFAPDDVDLVVEVMGGGSCDPTTGRVTLYLHKVRGPDGRCHGGLHLHADATDLATRLVVGGDEPVEGPPSHCFKKGQRIAVGEFTSSLVLLEQQLGL